MVQRFVGSIEAPGGKVAAIGGDVHGDVVLATGPAPLYACCPPELSYRLVGRDAALAELRDKLCGGGSAALTALNGLPGVGKTALATALIYYPAVRDHFKGGIYWAGLGPQGDVESAFNRWAAAMGVELRPVRELKEKAQELAVRIQERAEGEPVLLVADDVWKEEHARLVRAVAFPGCAYLCTTRDARVARRFAGEPTWVRELSDDEAEALLAARCPAARETDPEGLRTLATAAGGLPLGLSLIAVALADRAGHAQWVRKEIERLSAAEARLELAEEETRPGLEGVPATLRAIVEMSVMALEPEEQEAFAMLGAFAPKPADFGREAALAVWDVDESIGDAWLQRFLDRGLLESVKKHRFALHQVLGALAVARLGEETGARARHARFHRQLVDTARENWRQIEGELAQIQTGWAWVCDQGRDEAEVLAHAYALRIFFDRREMQREQLAWSRRALEAARSLKQRQDEGAMIIHMGAAYASAGDKKRALETYHQALTILRNIGNLEAEATTLNNLGTVYWDLGDKTLALETLEKILPIQREVGNRGGEATTLGNLAVIYSHIGNLAQTVEMHERALAIQREIGDREGQARSLNNLGAAYFESGNEKQALETLGQALTTVSEIGHRKGEATTLNNIGQVYSDVRDKKRALESFQKALTIFREVGDRRGEAITLNNIGTVCSEVGDKKRALETFEQVLPIRRDVGDRRGEAITLNNIGLVYTDLGNKKRALESYQQALPILRDVGDRRGEATALNNIGRVYSDLGDKKRALEAYQQALPMEREVGDRRGEAATLNNIGLVYSDLGNKKRALEAYQQALPIRREVGDRRGEAVTLFNIAGTREARGETAEAIALLERVVALDEALQHPDLASDRAYLERLRAVQQRRSVRAAYIVLIVLATAAAVLRRFLKL